jgi:L-2-hydroxyglutarate oxidase LhgO
MPDVGLTVVGAGVVGLAVAARLAPRFGDTVIVERQPKHGQETSSRNSEVIHAGIYYPTQSLKARLCVRGNRLLYELASRRGIPHRHSGKLIVATSSQELPELERLMAQAMANGALLERLSAGEARALEPNVRGVGALWSPTTGVVSAHALMDALLHDAKAAGATLQTRAELVGLERREGAYHLTLDTPDGPESFSSERVVNAAGLEADTVAALAGIDVDAVGYRLSWCKGSYFALAAGKGRLVSRLVYPVPNRVSLGVHAVVDVGGERLRFGPDAEYLDGRRAEYSVDEAKRVQFGAAVRRLFPGVADDDLTPDFAGIRPKLQGPGDPFRDFVIREERSRGLPGLVSVIGTDSPGLTSALAIAEEVEHLLG